MTTKFKYIQIALFTLVTLVSIAYSVAICSLTNTDRPIPSSDERNWTSTSIASYEMYFKGYQRSNVVMDSWFTTYAIENGLDTSAMDAKQKQWYDFAMWTFGWKAPNMGKFIMGSYISSVSDQELDKDGYYQLGIASNGEDPKIYYSRVSDDLVYQARIPNAIMNGLSIALIFLTGWIFLNFWAGFVASLYLLANHVYMMVNTAAGLDSPSIFFWILAVFFLAYCIRCIFNNEKLWKILLWALATGVSFGFAVSSKLNDAQFGYVCLFLFPLVALSILWARKPEKNVPFLRTIFGKRISALALSGIIIAGVGISLFWILNPQIQGSSVSESITKVKIVRQSVDEFFKRRANSQVQKNRLDKSKYVDVTYHKPAKAFNLITNRNFVVDNPDKYYGTFGKLLKFKGNFLDGLLVLIGLLAMIWTGFKKFRSDKRVNGEWIIALSFFVMLHGMCGFIWTDFARYHMAIYPGMALAIGFGIYTLVDLIIQQVHKKKAPAKA